MSNFNVEMFNRAEDIPDPIPGRFMLPRSVGPPVSERTNPELDITPVELSYIYLGQHELGRPDDAAFLRGIFRNEGLRDLVRGEGGSHMLRATTRVILHPDRMELFDLGRVYDSECKRTARAPAPRHERPIFEDFVANWGIVKRT